MERVVLTVAAVLVGKERRASFKGYDFRVMKESSDPPPFFYPHGIRAQNARAARHRSCVYVAVFSVRSLGCDGIRHDLACLILAAYFYCTHTHTHRQRMRSFFTNYSMSVIKVCRTGTAV